MTQGLLDAETIDVLDRGRALLPDAMLTAIPTATSAATIPDAAASADHLLPIATSAAQGILRLAIVPTTARLRQSESRLRLSV